MWLLLSPKLVGEMQQINGGFDVPIPPPAEGWEVIEYNGPWPNYPGETTPREPQQYAWDGVEPQLRQDLTGTERPEIQEHLDSLEGVLLKSAFAALIKVINVRLPAGQKITRQEFVDQAKQEIKDELGL